MTAAQMGTLATALAHAGKVLDANPRAAEAQAREILKSVADHPQALCILGGAMRRQGKYDEAREVLVPLASAQPKAASVHLELGLLRGETGETHDAIASLSRAVKLNPKLGGAWRELGDSLALIGDYAAADEAYAQHVQASVNDPQLLKAGDALYRNKLAPAEKILRTFLKEHPTDVIAIRMLAELGMRLGRYEEAEALFARCVELAPSFAAARHNYAQALFRQNKPAETLAEVAELRKREPRNIAYRNLEASALARIGQMEKAITAYEGILKENPQQPLGWMSYAHTLKSAGRQKDSIAAYRRSVAILPSLGEAYWSLANLKTFRFSPREVATMKAQLARRDLRDEDRFHFHFALGKAEEDAGHYAESFRHYDEANKLRAKSVQYDPDELDDILRRSRSLFTKDFFASHAGSGAPALDPIFIVGLPRAGSTLVEQILASHSAVEGTAELPEIISIMRRLSGRKRKSDVSRYPDAIADLSPEELRALGEEYISRTRIHRRLDRPYFIDKMPNNFAHVGLIHLILPHAKIVDARRHPLACCFSCFKQHFARGQGFTYGLEEVGRYYREYVELMAHWDAVLPGRVHRIHYERLVDEPESEVRKLLVYCGLDFEPACLRFYENERTVRTASSEQVRMPIFREGLDQWRNYDEWLDPLKDALGAVFTAYPDVPRFRSET